MKIIQEITLIHINHIKTKIWLVKQFSQKNKTELPKDKGEIDFFRDYKGITVIKWQRGVFGVSLKSFALPGR